MTINNGFNEKILDFILNHFPLARKQSITATTPIVETGVIDSIGILDLINFIETEFEIQLEDDDLTPEHFATVECIVQLIKRKQLNC